MFDSNGQVLHEVYDGIRVDGVVRLLALLHELLYIELVRVARVALARLPPVHRRGGYLVAHLTHVAYDIMRLLNL